MKILVIEDEVAFARLLKSSLEKENREIECVESIASAKALQDQVDFDLVICDISLPDGNGIQHLETRKRESDSAVFIMMTAHGSVDSALQAMKLGAYDYLQKPFEPEELEIVIERAFRERQLESRYLQLKQEVQSEYDFSQILGKSEPMQALFRKMRKAAETKSTVLIHGESGTGKELIARAIHYNSPRRDQSFVIVDCGSIPANLIESELFGHAKGAFTGAHQHRQGLAEEAHLGSLFLDEIGELPLEMQTKLLRFLQESTLRRVGETKAREVDVRIVAATNRDCGEEVKAKRFREDLFYRLNVIPLTAPSLRERQEDIPLLAQHFVSKFCKERKAGPHRLSPGVIQKLMSYSWPGNVRQLENVIEQMLVMADQEIIDEAMLPHPLADNPEGPEITFDPSEWDLKKALSKIHAYTEKYMIRRALQETNNNKTKAAQLLKISRRSLIYKAQEYGLDSEEAIE
ncbi:MAG: sigma-54-dependent Fis family transcriptional regulator [Bradymonadales bacterium]|nr:MAG: sigma-54-dependent Fis family transcriptional regulator [Bradymonadales bacterium]